MILFLLACAPDLAASHVWDDGDGTDPFAELRDDVHILFEPVGDDVLTLVDAEDASIWVYLDLDLEEETDANGPWDLRFSRFNISANSGISGDAGVEAVFVESADLADPGPVPDAGWRIDAVDGPDEDEDPDYALATWYDYDQETHILTPRDGVWIVRSDEGALFGLTVDSYYDAFGTSARFSLTWRGPLAP